MTTTLTTNDPQVDVDRAIENVNVEVRKRMAETGEPTWQATRAIYNERPELKTSIIAAFDARDAAVHARRMQRV